MCICNEHTLNAISIFIHILQQQTLELHIIPTKTPVEDASSHVMLDNSFQQPLENYSTGEILQTFPLDLPETETDMIASFNKELFGDFYQQQNDPPDDPPPLSPSVCCDYSSKHNNIPIPLLLL